MSAIDSSKPGARLALTAIVAAIIIAAAALAASLIAGDARAQTDGVVTVYKVGGFGQAFTINLTLQDDDDEVDASVAVSEGSSGTTDLLAGGIYTITEDVVAGWELVGTAPRSGSVCPPNPTITEGPFTIEVNGDESVCVYNEPTEQGTLVIEKVGLDDIPDNKTFTFSLDGPDEANSLSITGEDSDSVALNAGYYDISENDVSGFQLAGWAVLNDVEALCPAEPNAALGTGTLADVLIVPLGEQKVCAYNESSDITLRIAKILVGGTTDESFTFTVHKGAGQIATRTANRLGPSESVALTTGIYTIQESAKDGWEIVGWAEADTPGDCPDEPTDTADIYEFETAPGDNLYVCAYNRPTSPGTLEITKIGGGGNQSFTVKIAGPLKNELRSVDVPGGGMVSTDVPAGVLTLEEEDKAGYEFLGWANATDNDTCPAVPDEAAPMFPVTIAVGETTHVCLYNEPTNSGTLIVHKVGGAEDVNFTVPITDADDDEVDEIILAGGATGSLDLPPGTYTLSEDAVAGWVLTGWANANNDGSCPDAATDATTTFDVTIAIAEVSEVCLYNNQAPDTYTYNLLYPWNLIAWVGPTVVPIEDALRGEIFGAQVVETEDISELIDVVWHWNNGTQSWEAYFPDAPDSASDLEVLITLDAYWIHLKTDSNSGAGADVRWTVPTVLEFAD